MRQITDFYRVRHEPPRAPAAFHPTLQATLMFTRDTSSPYVLYADARDIFRNNQRELVNIRFLSSFHSCCVHRQYAIYIDEEKIQIFIIDDHCHILEKRSLLLKLNFVNRVHIGGPSRIGFQERWWIVGRVKVAQGNLGWSYTCGLISLYPGV